jgi:uncharacterized protein
MSHSVTTYDGLVVCESCVIAQRALPRMKGLLGRDSLKSGHGLLLMPAPSIHTFFMRFSIDAVFLSRDRRVLKIISEVRPWRIRSCRGANAVLELAAGEAERRGLTAGDRLDISPVGRS